MMSKRLISLVTVAVFVMTQGVSVYGLSPSETPPAETSAAQNIPGIPAELGKVTQEFKGASAETLVYIQDAHMNGTAQANIARIIQHLKEERKLTLVGLEGHQGTIDKSFFEELPFEDFKKDIFEKLLKENQVTGAEFAAFVKGSGMDFFGADDENLYAENLGTYVQSLEWRDQASKELVNLGQAVTNIKNKIFGKELRVFDDRLRALYHEQKSYKDYFEFLIQTAESQKVSLEKYPLLESFQKLLGQKGGAEPETVDFKGLMNEVSHLIREIKEKLYRSPDERKLDQLDEKISLLENFIAFRLLPEEFDSYRRDPSSFAIGPIVSEIAQLASAARVTFVKPEQIPWNWSALEKFYTLARARDEALVENSILQMREAGSSEAALVAGGFHSQGIQKALREKGVSFVVIQPQVDLDPRSLAAYEGAMRGARDFFTRQVPSSTLIELSNIIPIFVKTSGLDTREPVNNFWRDKIYGPLIQTVREANAKDPARIFVASRSVAGEIPEDVFLGSVLGTGLNLAKLDTDLRDEGFRLISERAWQEAEETVTARSLGAAEPGKSVKVMLAYLTGFMEEGNINYALGPEALKGYLLKVYNPPESEIRVDIPQILHSQRETVDEMIQRIEQESPAIVGLSVWHGALPKVKLIYDHIQKIPASRRPILVLGGILATHNRERLLDKRSYPDSEFIFPAAVVAVGEGEKTIEGLVRHAANPVQYPLESVPNIIFMRQNEEGQFVPYSTPREDVDFRTLPIPMRDRLDDYIREGSIINIQTSTGCTSRCAYCSRVVECLRAADEQAHNFKGLDSVVEDISLISRKGARKVNMVDDTFMRGELARLNEFADRILAEKEKWRKWKKDKDSGIERPEEGIYEHLLFYMTARIRDIWLDPDRAGGNTEVRAKIIADNKKKRETFKHLRRAGVMTLNIGVESGSDSQLKRYRKGVTAKEVVEAQLVLRGIRDELAVERGSWLGAEIDVEAGFIAFDPMVTFDELKESINFLMRTHFFSISYPFQQMRVQADTPIIDVYRKSGNLHPDEYDPNWLIYNYHYSDPRVASVLAYEKQWEQSIYRFFYEFKQLMRAMPTKDTMPGEHELLKLLFEESREIQFHLLKGLIDAEEGGAGKNVNPEEVRRWAFGQMNDRLRKYYFKFLYRINQGRIKVSREMFEEMIYESLIRNVITFDATRSASYNLPDLIVKLEPFTHLDLKSENEGVVHVPIDAEKLKKAVRTLVAAGDFYEDPQFPGQFRPTALFFELRSIQKIDLPKEGPPKSPFQHYDPLIGRALNVFILGPLGSGKTTAGKVLSERFKIPIISVKEVMRQEILNLAGESLLKDRVALRARYPNDFEKLEKAVQNGEEFALPPDFVQLVLKSAYLSKPYWHQLRRAVRGQALFPYEFVRDLLIGKIRSVDLSKGFVFEGGAYADKLYYEVFGSLGIAVDYVVFLEADQAAQKKIIEQTAEDLEKRKALINYVALEEKAIREDGIYSFFKRQPKLITFKAAAPQMDGEASVRTVFEALATGHAYILEGERDIPSDYYSANPEKAEILKDLLSGNYEGLFRAFVNYKKNYLTANHRQTVIENPANHPGARVSDQVLQLIMLSANGAAGTELVAWVKFIFGIEAVRLGLKNSSLAGFNYFLSTVIQKTKGTSSEREIKDILDARIGNDWPEIFAQYAQGRSGYQKAMESGESENEKLTRTVEKVLEDLDKAKSMELIRPYRPAAERAGPLNEGIMMFKAGVEMSGRTKIEILKRLYYFGYEIVTAERIDGPEMKRSGTIQEQYGVTARAAHAGAAFLTAAHRERLLSIYGEGDRGRAFKKIFGVSAEETPILGAYELGLSADEVNRLWAQGYDERRLETLSGKPKKKEREKPPRILVLDDDEVVRNIFKDNLEKNGIEVVTAKDAAEGLELLATKMRFDMIVTDVRMPGEMNGVDLVDKFIESDHPDIPIVFMSGGGDDDLRIADYRVRSKDCYFLKKPFGFNTEMARILREQFPDAPVGRAEFATSRIYETRFFLSDRELSRYSGKGRPERMNKGFVDGINKVGDRLYVEPVVHPRVNGGKPFFLLNGHFPKVEDDFTKPDAKVYVFAVRARDGYQSWQRMRSDFLGDTKPLNAVVGSIRNDLYNGILKIDKGTIDITNNGVHWSEGSLEGLKETLLWFSAGESPEVMVSKTALGRAMTAQNYSPEEIVYYLNDPIVRLNGNDYPLFSLVSKKDIDATIAFMLHHFPPYYPVRGTPSISFSAYQRLLDRYNRKELGLRQNLLRPDQIQKFDPATASPELVIDISKLAGSRRRSDYQEGVKLLREGKVARVLSTAGTAGRFFGYDIPESQRIRAMAPLFPLIPSGPPRSAFHIQHQINRGLQTRLGLPDNAIPTVFMTSDINESAVRQYFQKEKLLYPTYVSYGIPRMNPRRDDLESFLPTGNPQQIALWLHQNGGEGGIFEWTFGESSPKPPGHLDVISQLILSGSLRKLIAQGVEILDVADASNLGTLPDPELYGEAYRVMTEKNVAAIPVLAEKNVTYQGMIQKTVPFKVIVRGREIKSSDLSPEYQAVLRADKTLVIVRGGSELPPSEYTIGVVHERGGGLAVLDGTPQIVESFRIPPEFSQDNIEYFFTFRSFIKINAILEFYGIDKAAYMGDRISRAELLDKIEAASAVTPTYVEVKEVTHPDTLEKRVTAQLVRLYGDLFAHLKPAVSYFLIDRDGEHTLTGYAAYKHPEDVAPNQPLVARIIDRLQNVKSHRHPLVGLSDSGEETAGRSLGTSDAAALGDLIARRDGAAHTVLVVNDLSALDSLDIDVIQGALRNPLNSLSLYVPRSLAEKIPEKWKRKNLQVIFRDDMTLAALVTRLSQTPQSLAVIGSQAVVGQDLPKDYAGLKIVSDEWLGQDGYQAAPAGKRFDTFLSLVSFGLMTGGDRFLREHMEDKLVYDEKSKQYYLKREFALGDLMNDWVETLRGMLAIKRAA